MQKHNALQINRRKFVSFLGLLGTAAGLKPFSGFSKPSSLPEVVGGIMKCKPYLQAAQTDRITVREIFFRL